LIESLFLQDSVATKIEAEANIPNDSHLVVPPQQNVEEKAKAEIHVANNPEDEHESPDGNNQTEEV